MKYLYIIFLLPLVTIYSQTKGTVLKYEVFYNFNTPLSREIEVYTTNDFSYSIEKMDTTKKVVTKITENSKKEVEEMNLNSSESSSTVLKLDIKWDDKIVYTNKTENKLYATVQDIDLGRNITIEQAPQINWKILKETKVVENLNCVKALANFRGVDWEVWFTYDIPMPYGPWKLQGLQD